MKESPYKNKPQMEWLSITEKLIEEYPLSINEILEISLLVWDRLWTTKVGDSIELKEVELPATVIGYFFQKLFAHELSTRYPTQWIGEQNKNDKDLVNLQEEFFSTEMKSSGQLGYKIFGNRSYNQQLLTQENSGKDKSGYYITINFYKQVLTRISIGWIDQEDWYSQNSQTGQASTLKAETYQYKLMRVDGEYQLKSPIQLLAGVGEKKAKELQNKQICTFEDILNYSGKDKNIIKIRTSNQELLDSLIRKLP